MLSAAGLTLWRGELCLLDSLSFTLDAGQGMVIRGPNGCGKTTLLRVLCGLTRPEEGQVLWRGQPCDEQRAEFGRALAWCGHHTGLKADLTVRQNLEFAARLSGLVGQPWREPLTRLQMDTCVDLPVRYLSAGQQRRAALARVLMSPAPLWILDEPFANLDVAGRSYLENRLNDHLQNGGLAVIAAHHEMADASRYRLLDLGATAPELAA